METSALSSIKEVSNRILYAVAMNHAVSDGSLYLLSSLFPVLISLFALSVFQVGILVAVGYLISVVCQPIVGRYGEGIEPRKLLALGVSIISVSIISLILATSFLYLLGSVILLRVGSSFFHPVGVSAISRTYKGARLEKAMGFQSAFGNFGILVVFLTAAPLYLVLGLRSTFVIFAAIGLLDVLVTLSVLRGSPSDGSDSNGPGSGSPTSDKHGGWLKIPLFFVATSFISGGSFAVILNFTNILLRNQARIGVSEANLVVSAWIASAFFGAISTGALGRAYRRSVLLSLSYLLASVTMLIFAVFSDNLIVVVVTLLLNGFALSATYPLTLTYLSNYLHDKDHLRGQSFGIVFSAQTIGSSGLGFVGGYVSELFGLAYAFGTTSLLLLAAFFFVVFWTRSGGRLRSESTWH